MSTSAPTLSIRDVQQGRGLSGSRIMLFTIALSAAADVAVTFHAETEQLPSMFGEDKIAHPDVDFVHNAQDLTIPAGETTVSFPVTILGTSERVRDKPFFVNISHASVPVSRAQAWGMTKYGEYPPSS